MIEINEEKLKTIGKIIFISSDKRHRILKDDEIDWMNQKMKEIKKLAKSLPSILYKP